MSFTTDYIRILTENSLEQYATAEYAEKFELLCERMVQFNSHTNITAITEPREVILRHFADSLTCAPFLRGKKILDVGCGGGFPTLPLAIVYDGEFFALDSTAKKLVFVQQAASELGLSVTTLSGRAEEIANGVMRESFDCVISRAVARMNVLCELTLPFVRVGGRFIALKGADGIIECEEASGGIRTLGGKLIDTHEFELGDAGRRCIAVYEKVTPTPEKYPRAFGQIKKKPL